MGRCKEGWGSVGRDGEVWEGVERCGEVRGYSKVLCFSGTSFIVNQAQDYLLQN